MVGFILAGIVAGCGASVKIPSLNLGPVPSPARAEQYGIVNVPGKKVVFLPKGQIALSFSEFVQGDGDVYNGSVPAMTLEVSGPTGGPPYPKVTTAYGRGTAVNGHVWVRINSVDVLRAGLYRISVTGNVSGYIDPQILLGQ